MGESTYAIISFHGMGVEALQKILTLVASDSSIRLEGLVTNEIVKNALNGLVDVLGDYQPTNADTTEKTK